MDDGIARLKTVRLTVLRRRSDSLISTIGTSFPSGKTRTNSSKNRRIHTRFVSFAALSRRARIGYIDDAHVGFDGA